MKVLFDHQLFAYQRYGGASKYFACLLHALPRDLWDTTTLFSNNEYVKHLNLFSCRHFLDKYYFRGQGRIMNEINKPYTVYQLRKQKYDVFHQTHFEPYCLKAIGKKPMVTTFHDINHSTFNPNARIVAMQRKSLKRADGIVAISHNTKKDLMNVFEVDESKVHVIYHGIEIKKYVNSPSALDGIDYPYILYVGTRGHHKNFRRFVKAFSIFHRKFPDVKVICTFNPFTREEQLLFKQYGIVDSMIQMSVNEEMLMQLYRKAFFFIFPSLYEGFGMPILEAMANQCPVLLSDASCFPEIASDAGLYFDPLDVEDMADKMIRITDNPKLRTSFISKGIDRVKFFSWEKCAREHLKVYQSLL